MIGDTKALWPLLGVVALLQTVALGKMVFDRDRLLKNGREITLAARPLDPRDIFRGDYVTLGFDISSIHQTSGGKDVASKGIERGAAVYVTLSPDAEAGWKAASVSGSYPSEVKQGDVVLKGRVQNVWSSDNAADSNVNVRYGIEYYFVPEGEGKQIEDKVRERKTEAIVAVGDDGTAALKGLVVDGKRFVDPPLL